jgi:hypothetical protein
MTEKAIKYLKLVTLLGGIYEIIFGFILILFLVPLLNLMGLSLINLRYPIFNQTAGLLAIILGFILCISALNIKKFLINIIFIIILRFAIQIIIIINIFLVPEIRTGLLWFGLIDLIFAFISLYLIKVTGLKIKFKNLIQ